MYALVDAVSFYASAEKVFDPSIRNKPVVVLTNNDGCICAVCPIARRLGIPKFTPYFQIKALLHKHGVVVRSSNYELYADLSERMMNVIARYCDDQYIYSIDESFLHFKNYSGVIKDWHQYGHEIRRAIWKETRLPVGVGFGTTSTLAKAANHAAKKLAGYKGVAVIDNAQRAKEILEKMAVNEVWGIGSKISQRLKQQNISTAYQLSVQCPKVMRKQFSVLTERTVNELKGISCLTWDDVKAPKQEIFSTRSFGQRIVDIHTLQAALTTHSTIVAKKVRRQSSLIKKLLVFASNSPHDENYYKQTMVYTFTVATDNSCDIATAVSLMLAEIFIPGVHFYRCGVGAIALESRQYQQADLFVSDNSNPILMNCLDSINRRYGKGTLTLGAEGKSDAWQMKRHFLSPQYTSNWRDIPKIRC
ncbi:Y-family DNA polymerase [Colwellia hornerae]|uniref:Y-family DNA polymerase n=1 Tax=Colwellia hornerae TaxID=89402 RepID=A0A5C6Q2H2_9GAMM|nr:Y-family DNA polymerase [Colwellia hornerae]TWX46541.1 Y-family DNA polymerase [Colwellia hornerae]TWX54289.1 Y-family DNA polymerase [Colwellia hornerae]TWX63066.1 Y-family DNA polymerase [Colwellia hornerae]